MQLVAWVSLAQALESCEHLRIHDASNTSMKDSDQKTSRMDICLDTWTIAYACE